MAKAQWSQWMALREESVKERRLRPLTAGQESYWRALLDRDLVLCTGPAGSGKTYLACAAAAQMMAAGKVKRVVLTRPLVTCGRGLGWLPGDQREKSHPYMMPLFDALEQHMGKEAVAKALKAGDIEAVPLELMRGSSYKGSFVIVDEAQNADASQLRMAVTRLDHGSRMAVVGDVTQTDVPGPNSFARLYRLVHERPHARTGTCELTREDIVRGGLVRWLEDIFEGEDWLDYDCPSCGSTCWFLELHGRVSAAACWKCGAVTAIPDDMDEGSYERLGPHADGVPTRANREVFR